MGAKKTKNSKEEETIERYRHRQDVLLLKGKCIVEAAEYTKPLSKISERYMTTEISLILKSRAFEISDVSREACEFRLLDSEIREKVSIPIARIAKEFEAKLPEDDVGKEGRRLFYEYLENEIGKLSGGTVADRTKYWIREEMKAGAIKDEKRTE